MEQPIPVAADPASLRAALRAFHEVSPARSWRELCLALGLLALVWPLLWVDLPLGLRLLLAPVVAGLMLRLCSLGHDHTHGAILRGSALARWVVQGVGLIVLAPPRIWADTHHAHHARTAALGEPAVGSFPVWTRKEYQEASPAARLGYRLARSPLLMLLGWPLVFVLGLNLLPALGRPARYWTSLLALLVHLGLNLAAWRVGGALTWAVAVALPYGLLAAAGSWLFYVQHNFPGARWFSAEDWRFEPAALHGSSYLELPGWLGWLAGNIHYHHVHHLDARVPFYRLPEAFAALPGLRRDPDLEWSVAGLLGVHALAVWHEGEGRWLTWSELREC